MNAMLHSQRELLGLSVLCMCAGRQEHGACWVLGKTGKPFRVCATGNRDTHGLICIEMEDKTESPLKWNESPDLSKTSVGRCASLSSLLLERRK